MLQETSRRGEIPWRPERAQIHQEAEECAAQEGAAETALHQVPPQLPPAQAGQFRRPPVLRIGCSQGPYMYIDHDAFHPFDVSHHSFNFLCLLLLQIFISMGVL